MHIDKGVNRVLVFGFDQAPTKNRYLLKRVERSRSELQFLRRVEARIELKRKPRYPYGLPLI